MTTHNYELPDLKPHTCTLKRLQLKSYLRTRLQLPDNLVFGKRHTRRQRRSDRQREPNRRPLTLELLEANDERLADRRIERRCAHFTTNRTDGRRFYDDDLDIGLVDGKKAAARFNWRNLYKLSTQRQIETLAKFSRPHRVERAASVERIFENISAVDTRLNGRKIYGS